MQIIAISTKLFHEGDNLLAFLIAFLPQLQEKDIVIVTSKIIALAESRTSQNPTPESKKHLIRTESEESIETPWCLLTRKGADWSANAGIDESNAQGKLILLPKNPKQTAIELQQQLKNHYNLQELGVIVSDTRLVPLRTGTLGIALAWSGIQALTDYRGTKDLFGRELKMTQANIVHALATSAVLCMGEGAEQKPLALIQQAPIIFSDSCGEISDLAVLPEHDLYGYVYAKHPVEPPKPQAPATS